MAYCDTLQVVLGGVTVGWLHQPFDTYEPNFKYDEGWLSKNYPPISLSLPLTDAPFGRVPTTNFFGSLVPDESAMAAITAYRRLPTDDFFTFLRYYGKEAAGALSIFSPDESPPVSGGGYRDVTDLVTESVRTASSKIYSLVIDTNSKVSLAGAQNKLPVLLRDGRLLVPADDGLSPTSHIIKPDSPLFPNLQLNEAFCMELAAASGLPVPKSGIIHLDAVPVFIVERFDRRLDPDGGLARVHQEDFCQAMSVDKRKKYEDQGGPGFKACSKTLLEMAEVPAKDYENFIKAIFFNYIIGNCDAHAKNFSIQHDFDFLDAPPNRRSYRLAPLYDLVSTRFYDNVSTTMSMFIGGTSEHGKLGAGALARLAEDLSIDRSRLADVADGVVAEASRSLEPMIEKHSDAHKKPLLYQGIGRQVRVNCRKLSKQVGAFRKTAGS